MVVGPCFSLSASGLLGKALLYYEHPWGARVRAPKKTFVPPAPIWEVNQVWFKAASDRSKTLNTWQKRAWEQAYPGICDNWRDIFMGKQIEYWNMSPLNDLTWPPVSPQDIGDLTFRSGTEFVGSIYWTLVDYDVVLMTKWVVSTLWWRILNNPRVPVESDLVAQKARFGNEFSFVAGNTNYLWGGVRYVNGTWKAQFLGSYVK